MSFSFEEVLNSLFLSLLFGVIFALFSIAASLSLSVIISFVKGVTLRIKSFSNFPLVTRMKYSSKTEAVLLVFEIISMGIIFSILSYISLDGSLRTYTFLLFFASFYISKNLVFGKLISFIEKPLSFIVFLLSSAVFRSVFAPVGIFRKLLKKMSKNGTNKSKKRSNIPQMPLTK